MNVVRLLLNAGGLKYFLYDIDIGSNESSKTIPIAISVLFLVLHLRHARFSTQKHVRCLLHNSLLYNIVADIHIVTFFIHYNVYIITKLHLQFLVFFPIFVLFLHFSMLATLPLFWWRIAGIVGNIYMINF